MSMNVRTGISRSINRSMDMSNSSHQRSVSLSIQTPTIELSHNDIVQALKESNNNEPLKPFDAEYGCICNRQTADIFCEMCGHCFLGRVRRQCELHKGVMHLMDLANCPSCYSDKIREISP